MIKSRNKATGIRESTKNEMDKFGRRRERKHKQNVLKMKPNSL